MSTEAMKWAMELAPPMPPQLVAVLTGLAYHADKAGKGSYPSVPRLAAYACKDPRSVQRDLKKLVELKLIRLGDQSKAAHLPAGKRPEVYDLAVEWVVQDGRAGRDETTLASRVTLASSRKRGGRKKPSSALASSDLTGDVDVRGDVDVTGDVDVADGVTPTSQVGWRGRHPNQLPEPTTEPKDSSAPAAPSDDDAPSLFDSLESSPPPATASRQADDHLAEFEIFWKAYPKRMAKPDARKAWKAALKDGADPAQIITAAEAYALAKRGKDPQFIKYPAGWLRSARYEDEPEPAATGPTHSGYTDEEFHSGFAS
ncbi:helix-turn-helix domain-containing protein [Streptomyces sp. H10-C2]|uniref:helix-turn-helix domain-containing protein n=1 Tax=unclassified Streptomyces TaxID=2593676 RepID=UPI0024BA16DC|nr:MULTISPECIES: helix-turn-helix domain-containing protein [unclassified Streptomyces]MDJ0342213.1 helix-turn-helix domain-containing protein [Streptomyces sp. PH10-H1]MDJ0368727.1 helix-turn-helix domain-containing protein [Streptomyces sp. H10-C2]